ncbi:RNA-directed DNA polymerase (reverse transcriptase)-related family protein [Rhynchospora pubera]|uniref:RNA-directed DNA polymerase (Reverse transcriptase)-related family protein n=1 Tax=Rhynchospora pubera TaxID=906938 RepID=A0AAV8HBA6_9POAL|nr:RNA-directed DNA polymerase (reverse transcriptase)-related family protein [Rhynchospora pubera]
MELFWFDQHDFHTLANDTWNSFVALPAAQRFFAKNDTLQKHLHVWHKNTFPHVNVHLANAKAFIALFDSLEEVRTLTRMEFRLRILLREQAFFLAKISEQKWHQRARIKWLSCGDRNTRFFHAVASAKMRKKRINNLSLDGNLLTDQNSILQAFTCYFKDLLGSHRDVYPCSLQTLYGQRPLLDSLDSPFTTLEIKHAVSSLSSNKASGPDGIPNEFAKLKWDILHCDLLAIFSDLYAGTLDLKELNLAHITLLPKNDLADTLTAFRPISIINYIPKLISKVLASRLSPHLHNLVSPTQSGFVRGRLIQENFLSAREIVTHLSKCKQPAIMLKLDFFKAFDTVNWSFLFNVLRTFGIPPKFISWIELLLTTSKSAVLINNQIGNFFQHFQGLRQGDPLSPFMFILVADVLSKMCQAMGQSLAHSISTRLLSPFCVLQYADDTLIFATTKGKSLQTLKLLLDLFSLVSGLNLNLAKSSFTPFNLSSLETDQVKLILHCEASSLPLPYLGLPLTANRPTKENYLQLIEKLESKLAGWKNKLLSRAGRITLVSSVLSAIPIFFMSVFRLHVWVLKAIDKLRRNFLWGRAYGPSNGIPLLAWDRVCLPKSLGGFGILNLKLLNIALLMKWLWRLSAQPTSQWSVIANLLISNKNRLSPLSWTSNGSFFWKDLLQLRHLFAISTTTALANGKSTLFWFDNWGLGHLHFFNSLPKPLKPFSTVHKCVSDPWSTFPAPFTSEINNALQYLQSLPLHCNNPDQLLWKWDSSGLFSVKSAYRMLVSAGKITFPCPSIWKVHLPPSIQVFALLLFHNRLLTQEALLKRQIAFVQGCVLCDQALLETTDHLFCQCPFVRALWAKVRGFFPSLSLLGFVEVRSLLISALKDAHSDRNSLLAIVTITTLWAIWLERNNRTFREVRRSIDSIMDWIVSQQTLFLKYC